MLELQNVSKTVGGETFADGICASFSSDTINILLGPTGSGKTTLMRLIAGLDSPDSGTLRLNGQDITGVSVQQRNVAMVYQQFINYPSLTVYENIASPMRIAKVSSTEIHRRVLDAAKLLKLSGFLERMPPELSGGQQQRVALARALVKDARIVLLDEPLANLDYKLREELREELPAYFTAQGTVLIYATTEPNEALLLGGNTCVMHEGRIAQAGPTQRVFCTPDSLTSARAFSDPPLNTLNTRLHNGRMQVAETHIAFDLMENNLADGLYTLGIRPYHLRLRRKTEGDIELAGKVVLSEITGSESFLHIDLGNTTAIAHARGVHDAAPGESIRCFIAPEDCFIFRDTGETVRIPISIVALTA
ncbi:MAG: ABC transporter ATP-binding protein [Halioglobus sp.]